MAEPAPWGTSEESPGPSLSYVVGRLDRAIRTRLAEVLLPHELTVAQFTTLSVLARRPGLSNAQLARRALILPQSTIQVLATLEQRGLVVRTPAHGRTLLAELTPAGRALVRRAEPATQAVEAVMVGDGDPGEAERTMAVLQRWSEALAVRR